MRNTRTRVLALTTLATLLSALALVVAERVDAVSTRSFVLDGTEALAAGELDGTAAHSNGTVTVGAELTRIDLPDVPIAYAMARQRDGTAFIGTGNDGKIYRLQGEQLSLYAETNQLVVTSLATARDGTLYAGTLPDGKIFRIEGPGRVHELARPADAEHVWDLVWDERRGILFAATGPEGKVYAIDRQGQADTYYDSTAAHIMSLALDAEGRLYAGTSGDALVVRLTGPGRAEVVYDFPGNEITAIDVRGGTVAVAANEFPDPPSVSSPTKGTKRTPSAPPRPRPGKGRLWKVGADGRAEEIFRNDDGHFTSVQLLDDGTVFAGSGKDGRIYRVAADRTSATWIDVDERQVLDIDMAGDHPMFITGDAGAIYRVLPGPPRNAMWTSKVLDARFGARFGQLTWRGHGQLSFQTRSGNTEEPDTTWSAWSSAMSRPGPIRSEAARFLQIRASFPSDASAVLWAATAYYLPQNQRSVVSDIGLKREDPSKASKTSSGSQARSDDDPPEASTSYKLTWKVDNPDDDRLRYRLRFRAEHQAIWREILPETEELTATEYEWQTNGIPDGHYILEVEASDELSNPVSSLLRAAATSEPLLIDNHPPIITGLSASGVRIRGQARDGLGPIAKLELAIDGGRWQMFFPADDLFDTREEAFDVDVTTVVGPLDSGDHIAAVRASDAGGNTVSAEVTLRVGGSAP